MIIIRKKTSKDDVTVENTPTKTHVHYKTPWNEAPRNFTKKIVEFEDERRKVPFVQGESPCIWNNWKNLNITSFIIDDENIIYR